MSRLPAQELVDWGVPSWDGAARLARLLSSDPPPRYAAVEDYRDHVSRILRRAERAGQDPVAVVDGRIDPAVAAAGYCRIPARQWALGERPDRPSMDGLYGYMMAALEGTPWLFDRGPGSPYYPHARAIARVIRGYFAGRPARACLWRDRRAAWILRVRCGLNRLDTAYLYRGLRGPALLARVSRACARAVAGWLVARQWQITRRAVVAGITAYTRWAAAGHRAAAEAARAPARVWLDPWQARLWADRAAAAQRRALGHRVDDETPTHAPLTWVEGAS